VVTMRAFWEWRGYRETMKFHYAWFGTPTPVFREYLVKEFISSNYLWMFPFKGYMNRLVDKAALQIVDEVEGPPGYVQGS